MTNIRIEDIRVGDEVTLAAGKVMRVYMSDGLLLIERRDEKCPIWVTPSELATHTPAPREFKVGDRVRTKSNEQKGKIVGINKGQAWVEWYLGGRKPIWNLTDLEHADD